MLFPPVPGKVVDPFVFALGLLIVSPKVSPLVPGLLCHRNSYRAAQRKGPLNKVFIAQGCVRFVLEAGKWQHAVVFGRNPQQLVGKWAGAAYKLTCFDERILMRSNLLGSQVTIFMVLVGALTANTLLMRVWGLLLIFFEAYCLYTVYVWGFSESMPYHMPDTYLIGNSLTWVPICIGIAMSFFPEPVPTGKHTPLLA